ncbi:hypothetical protein AVEN_175964-1 [Araneus ventricosus]|uniref:Uncharacterized protein n=1 Tax=Araneus ventricosus TaxID=182803 RepID=A0A4Y2BE94_ARAVE|nr:hypothetical protein AVEN_175964-1 [Araneus ventricosus]
MWRLNEFNLSEKSHTVVRLAVRLTDQQAIVYQDGQEEEAVARAAARQRTLTAWFELNEIDQNSHNYLYTDIPHYYTFNKSPMKWQKRQRGGEQVIGRMPVVNIQDSERYYLPLLLFRKLGAMGLKSPMWRLNDHLSENYVFINVAEINCVVTEDKEEKVVRFHDVGIIGVACCLMQRKQIKILIICYMIPHCCLFGQKSGKAQLVECLAGRPKGQFSVDSSEEHQSEMSLDITSQSIY